MLSIKFLIKFILLFVVVLIVLVSVFNDPINLILLKITENDIKIDSTCKTIDNLSVL